MNDAGRGATTQLAARRNELVATLADEVWFVHIPSRRSDAAPRNTVAMWGAL